MLLSWCIFVVCFSFLLSLELTGSIVYTDVLTAFKKKNRMQMKIAETRCQYVCQHVWQHVYVFLAASVAASVVASVVACVAARL